MNIGDNVKIKKIFKKDIVNGTVINVHVSTKEDLFGDEMEDVSCKIKLKTGETIFLLNGKSFLSKYKILE